LYKYHVGVGAFLCFEFFVEKKFLSQIDKLEWSSSQQFTFKKSILLGILKLASAYSKTPIHALKSFETYKCTPNKGKQLLTVIIQ